MSNTRERVHVFCITRESVGCLEIAVWRSRWEGWHSGPLKLTVGGHTPGKKVKVAASEPVSVAVPLRLICSPSREFHQTALAFTTQGWREEKYERLVTVLAGGAAHETTPPFRSFQRNRVSVASCVCFWKGARSKLTSPRAVAQPSASVCLVGQQDPL